MVSVAVKEHIISQLQRDILLLEGYKPFNAGDTHIDLDAINHVFPNSTFPTGAVHEFFSSVSEEMAASCGFVATLVSQIMKGGAPAVWVSAKRTVFPPALKLFDIDPHNVLFIEAKKLKDMLWIIEETLKSDCASAVVGEISDMSLIESRRLQLAVERSNATAFILRKNPKNLTTSCLARWRVKPLPSHLHIPGSGYPKWNVELLKVRNGKSGQWQMEWRNRKLALIQEPTPTQENLQRKIV